MTHSVVLLIASLKKQSKLLWLEDRLRMLLQGWVKRGLLTDYDYEVI